MNPPLPNGYWVEPGRLLAGEHPAAESESRLGRRLARLLEAGVTCFVDLTQPGEMPDYAPQLPAGVAVHRLPLPDHDVPREPAAMRAVQRTLRQALQQGQVVYLHCRAGIGRTGLSVGCHLVEQGMENHAALEHLNALWQQNALSEFWPRIPETEAQEDYVLAWRGDARSPTALARAQGALLGLALGDALSTPSRGLAPGQFPPVTGLRGGGPSNLPPGAWSDDTSMALCVAESLLEQGGVDMRDQVTRYRRWLQEGHLTATGEAVAVRPAVRRAVALAGWRRAPVQGSHDPRQLDCEALGRCVAPALYFHGDLAAAVAAGADAARVTHQAPLVVDACRLYTGMLHRALAGAPRAEILALGSHWPLAALKPELTELAAALARPARRRGGRGANILTVLEEVGRAFAGGEPVEVALLALVNRGGESDVAAAAYGALAGAHHGVAALPPEWREALVDPGRLTRIAEQLLQSPGV